MMIAGSPRDVGIKTLVCDIIEGLNSSFAIIFGVMLLEKAWTLFS